MIPDGLEKSYMKEIEHPGFSSLNEYVSVTDTCSLTDLTCCCSRNNVFNYQTYYFAFESCQLHIKKLVFTHTSVFDLERRDR